jgi:hypothetical protein
MYPPQQRLLHELETSLPSLDRLLSDSDFDPTREETSFRIPANDHACHVICPLLCGGLCLHPESESPSLFSLWHDGQFEAME